MTTNTLTLPLNKLYPSPKNVRRTGKNDSIDELVASIRAKGLRQNLNVEAVGEDRYEVVAGGRRLRALKRLAREKHIPKDFPVPCLLLTQADDAGEISLAENVCRIAMHPADQFEAFHSLARSGMPIDKIAERFGIDTGLVERRLKLASVAPALMKAYRKEDLTLDQLMAFTVTDDHDRQLDVWRSRNVNHLSPSIIRMALTEGSLPASNRIARFVGTEAYVAAGGTVIRDLFDTKNEGYFSDGALLMRLAADRLSEAEDAVRAEGWKWVASDTEYTRLSFRYVYPVEPDCDGDEDEADNTPAVYAPEDMARAGALLTINHDGTLRIERGLIHPDDVLDEQRQAKPSIAKPDAAKGEYAATIVADLTAHRTAALQTELVHNPAVALAAMVHALALPLFYGRREGSSLSIEAKATDLGRHVKETQDCTAHDRMTEQAERWRGFLPEDPDFLFDWLLNAEQYRVLDLLAFLTALSLDAVQSKFDQPTSPRLAHADALADAVGLDMTQHWQGTHTGFYASVPKAALVAAISEAKAPISVQLSACKKQEAARYAAKALAETDWLPAPLRKAPALAPALEDAA